MTDNKTDNNEPTTTTKKKTPTTPDIVVGSNKGHAQRHAKNKGYPHTHCIPITDATPELLKGKTIALARDPHDRAANWTELETYDCTILKQ